MEVSDDAIDFEGKDFLLLLVEKQNENLVKTESDANARFRNATSYLCV